MMSATHANRGKSLESALEWQHEIYKSRGLFAAKLPTPYKVTGKAAKGLTVVPDTVALPDYLACAGGIAYLVDAKSTTEDRWPLSKLTAHQADAMTTWAKQGPAFRAGLVLQMGDRSIWWVSWAVLAFVWRRWQRGEAKQGQASLDGGWLVMHAVKVAGLDWLAGATK